MSNICGTFCTLASLFLFFLLHLFISYEFADYLGTKLEDYVATLPVKTFVLRTYKRSGLIRARLLGAKHVTVCYSISIYQTFHHD